MSQSRAISLVLTGLYLDTSVHLLKEVTCRLVFDINIFKGFCFCFCLLVQGFETLSSAAEAIHFVF